MAMKQTLAIVLLAILLPMMGIVHATASKTLQVLFVGNSLTYVGNLPAVFTTLAANNRHRIQADMLVKGGATLTQWLDSGAVQRALASHHYDYVVLQERGGDFTCNFGPAACKDARHSLGALAHIVRTNGARPILLGTYVPYTASSNALVAAESSVLMPRPYLTSRFRA